MEGNYSNGVSNGISTEARSLCIRCKSSPFVLALRGDNLCRDCFVEYVETKVTKRIDIQKVRNQNDGPRRLLLPLSFGASSLTLLHVLDQHIRMQLERSNRTSYAVHILIIDETVSGTETYNSDLFGDLLQRYPLHTYSTLLLEDALRYSERPEDLESTTWEPLTNISCTISSSSMHGIVREHLSSLPSATSQSDLVGILRTRLVVGFAKEIGYECITWGDSTTRLAEKTLSETAKGRGFSLPWQTADGLSPHGILSTFPMRDITRKELITYSTFINPPLETLISEPKTKSQTSASSKNATIDDLMSQFFESVEQNYPSIVANVVRTSSRLKAIHSSDLESCRICNLPLLHGTQGIDGWGGLQATKSSIKNFPEPDNDGSLICYGCVRSFGDSKGPVPNC